MSIIYKDLYNNYNIYTDTTGDYTARRVYCYCEYRKIRSYGRTLLRSYNVLVMMYVICRIRTLNMYTG